MEILLATLLVGLSIFIIYDKFFKNSSKNSSLEKFEKDLQKYKYLIKKTDYLTTPAEGKFFRRLSDFCQNKDYFIFSKVRIGDIIRLNSTKSGFRPFSIASRIDRSHIDFVLVRKSTLTIFCAIELDDPSHKSQESSERDRIKDILFQFVDIPIIRFSDISPTDEDFIKKGL